MVGRLFNGKHKREFLDQVGEESSKNMYRWIFNHTYEYEQKYPKDVFDFKLQDIEEFIEGITKQKKRRQSYLTFLLDYLSHYIDWGHKKGYQLISGNPIKDRSERTKIANKYANQLDEYFSIYDVYALTGVSSKQAGIPPLKNYQDHLLIILAFLGVAGEGLKELLHLKKSDVDFNEELVTLDGRDEPLQLNSLAMDILDRSISERRYELYTAGLEPSAFEDIADLGESDYVFRAAYTQGVPHKSKDKPLSISTLHNRMHRYTNYTGQKITVSKLKKSGMLYTGKLLIDRDGYVSQDNVRTIAQRYGYSDSVHSRNNIARFIKNNIDKVYPEYSGQTIAQI